MLDLTLSERRPLLERFAGNSSVREDGSACRRLEQSPICSASSNSI